MTLTVELHDSALQKVMFSQFISSFSGVDLASTFDDFSNAFSSHFENLLEAFLHHFPCFFDIDVCMDFRVAFLKDFAPKMIPKWCQNPTLNPLKSIKFRYLQTEGHFMHPLARFRSPFGVMLAARLLFWDVF